MSTPAEAVGAINPVELAKIRAEIRMEERKAMEDRLEAWKAKELAALEDKQREVITEQLQKLQEKIQNEQKPLTKEAIQDLVNQEYAEISIRIPVEQEDGTFDDETFVLRELPQSIERKFYRQFKDRVKDKGSELAAFSQKNREEPFEKQIVAFLETFDGGFDVMCDAVTLILNPFGKRREITPEWVADHISCNRAYSIILAQVEVNRLRDFFSKVFTNGQRAGTLLTPLNIQSLQQLAR